MPATGPTRRLRKLSAHLLADIAHAPAAALSADEPIYDPDMVCTDLTAARRQLDVEGFAIIDNAVEPEQLPILREEARRVAEMARLDQAHDLNGGFVSRDFPGDHPWSVRGLFAPGWEAPSFAEYMASEPVLDLVREFLECEPEDLLLPDADCILFINVPGRDRTQAWVRFSLF